MSDIVSVAQLLLDLFGKLKSGPADRRDKFFHTHVEPLQLAVEKIHKDYQSAFAEVYRRLTAKKTSSRDIAAVKEVIAFLYERRRQLEPERQLAKEIALQLKETRRFRGKESDAVLDYCEATAAYLSASNPVTGVCGTSWFTDFIEAAETKVMLLEAFQKQESKDAALDVWASLAISGQPRREVVEAVDEVLHRLLPAAYLRVCATFARIRGTFL